MSRIITLLTDFGLHDAFVGVMKGVMLAISPNSRLIDVTHNVPNQNIEIASFVLKSAWQYFPPGTVHMVVVDPGVGSGRRAIAAQSNGHTFVAPDNGVLSPILDGATVRSLDNDAYFLDVVSRTFHGRDVFAPVSAHLSRGVDFESLGERVSDPVWIPHAKPVDSGNQIFGEILYIDKFGNAMTNIPATMLNDAVEFGTKDVSVEKLSESYADGLPGQLIAIINSAGLLEFAVNGGDAAALFSLGIGHPAHVRKRTGENSITI